MAVPKIIAERYTEGDSTTDSFSAAGNE